MKILFGAAFAVVVGVAGFFVYQHYSPQSKEGTQTLPTGASAPSPTAPVEKPSTSAPVVSKVEAKTETGKSEAVTPGTGMRAPATQAEREELHAAALAKFAALSSADVGTARAALAEGPAPTTQEGIDSQKEFAALSDEDVREGADFIAPFFTTLATTAVDSHYDIFMNHENAKVMSADFINPSNSEENATVFFFRKGDVLTIMGVKGQGMTVGRIP